MCWDFQKTPHLSRWPKLLHLSISKPIIGRDKWDCHGWLRQPIGLSHETLVRCRFFQRKTLSHTWVDLDFFKEEKKRYGWRKRKHQYLPQKLNTSAIFHLKNVIKFWLLASLESKDTDWGNYFLPLAIWAKFYIKHQTECLSFSACLMNKWKSPTVVDLLSLLMTLQMEMEEEL